ncbi:MAG TPA: SpoIIE family protein phosphatase [Ramlibacter sp.]
MTTSALTAGAAAPVEPRDHYLVFLEGVTPGRRIRLGERPLRIGRHAANELAIADHRVSGHHCELSLAPMTPSIRVVDLGSTNGTYVEGRRVEGRDWLAPGEILRFGDQVVRHEHLTRTEAQHAEAQQKDIEKARHYVESLLPAPLLEGPVRASWSYVPSAHLGGDAFGYSLLDQHTFGIYLIDVSGHGVGAAMHSVSVMNVMRQRALPGCDFREPAQVLRSLNDMFQMEKHDGMFFSMWYGVYDLASRVMRFASAGHHASYLVGADRQHAQALRTRNLVVGAKPPGGAFLSDETLVTQGAVLYVFSDGVFEIDTPAGAQLGLAGFTPLLQQPAADAAHEARRIHDAVKARAKPGPLADDFTLLAVTFPSN